MKDLRLTKKLICIDIYKDMKMCTLQISQDKYIKKIIICFVMKNTKTMNTPLSSHLRLFLAYYPKTKQE